MAKKIIIKIDPKTATIEYTVDGVQGASCTDITSALVQGQEVTKEGFSESYYVPDTLPAYQEDSTDKN